MRGDRGKASTSAPGDSSDVAEPGWESPADNDTSQHSEHVNDTNIDSDAESNAMVDGARPVTQHAVEVQILWRMGAPPDDAACPGGSVSLGEWLELYMVGG